MKYKCQNCGFIHEGNMPDGYYCPICRNNYSYFILIAEEKKQYNRKTILPDNPSINRIKERCINCGVCSKTCESIVNIKDDSVCINCGQCILTCPTGALTPKYDYKKVLEFINNKDYVVVAITSPAVRVGIGDAFGFTSGEYLEGKMVSALKKIGFNYVFDTTFGADLTSIEEAAELKEKIKNKEVMFSSCCPSWISYAEKYHPELIKNISTCKSPIGMQAAIIKKYYSKEEEMDLSKVIIVAITPCTSKKQEIIDTDCDYCITSSELSCLIRELNIDFKNLEDDSFDTLKGSSSGTIYGVSGGVTLSVLRCLYHSLTNKDLTSDEVSIVNKDFYKEIKVKINKDIIKCACVSTLKKLEKILEIKDEFNFIEVMNCNGGCIYGGGQVIKPQNEKDKIIKARAKSLLKKDKQPRIKYPYKNVVIKELYEEYLEAPGSNLAKKILHKKR